MEIVFTWSPKYRLKLLFYGNCGFMIDFEIVAVVIKHMLWASECI